jgi:hypothetical protein
MSTLASISFSINITDFQESKLGRSKKILSVIDYGLHTIVNIIFSYIIRVLNKYFLITVISYKSIAWIFSCNIQNLWELPPFVHKL